MLKYAVEQYEGNSTVIVEIHPVEGGSFNDAKKLISKLRRENVVAANEWDEQHIDELEEELFNGRSDIMGGKLVDRFIPRLYFVEDGELIYPVNMYRSKSDKQYYYNVGGENGRHKFVKLEDIERYLNGDAMVVLFVDCIPDLFYSIGREVVEIMHKKISK